MFPQHIIDQYGLLDKVHNGHIYVEICNTIYGLPQAGRLANQLFKKILKLEGYYEVPHTLGLWKHTTRLIQFTMVMDDFGVKYTNEDNFKHLVNAFKKNYKLKINDTGGLYCDITLMWNYIEGYVGLSMPEYIQKLLERYLHTRPTRP